MTRAEYMVTLHYCHIRCTPNDKKCKNCYWIKAYEQIYGDEEYSPKYYSAKEKRYKIFCI